MLGFAVAGVVLTRALPAVLARRDEFLAAFGALFALTLLATSAIFSHLPAGAQFTTDPAVFVEDAADLASRRAPLRGAVRLRGADPGRAALRPAPARAADLRRGPPGLRPGRAHRDSRHPPPRGGAEPRPVRRGRRWPGCWRRPGRAGRRPARSRPRPRRAHRARGRAAGPRVPGQGARGLRWSAMAATQYGIEYVQWDPVARIEISRIPPPRPGHGPATRC